MWDSLISAQGEEYLGELRIPIQHQILIGLHKAYERNDGSTNKD